MSRITRAILPLLCLVIALLLNGCSGGGGSDALGGDAWRYDPGLPEKISLVQAVAGDELVTLSWTSQYVATSYNIYYAPEGTPLTKATATRLTLNGGNFYAVQGLTNGITYQFMVTAANHNGEGPESDQVTAKPSPISQEDLQGTWYFHTLVCGPGAKWERGSVSINAAGDAVFLDFMDSAHHNPVDDTTTYVAPPPDVVLLVQGLKGELAMSGTNAWPAFHGWMGSRKNMMVGTWTYAVDNSRAITVFQKKRAVDDYDVWDVAGTGSQNPRYPALQGNGPTRFAYHGLNSGSSIEWEYSNARVGQQAQFWSPPVSTLFPEGINSIKDIIFWDYSTPNYKTWPMWDLLWKVTCFGVQPDGLVKEYDSFADTTDGYRNIIFTGRMTDDKTVIVGVSTKNAIDPTYNSTGSIITVPGQYFMRILQLNFIPTDQSMPTYTLADLAGNYKFHKIGTAMNAGVAQASWAYGMMQITTGGVTTFPQYADSSSATSTPDTFTLAYYPDTGSDNHTWTTFANFVSPNTGAVDAYARYYNPSAQPYVETWTWWNRLTTLTQSGEGVRQVMPATTYFNEHGTLSYVRDLFVLTRTDGFGYSMIIGLK
jgi:hypothetical protein